MISQALHPLRRFSKLVGRRLSLLAKEVNILSPYFSLPAMIGVRDMFFVSSIATLKHVLFSFTCISDESFFAYVGFVVLNNFFTCEVYNTSTTAVGNGIGYEQLFLES